MTAEFGLSSGSSSPDPGCRGVSCSWPRFLLAAARVMSPATRFGTLTPPAMVVLTCIVSNPACGPDLYVQFVSHQPDPTPKACRLSMLTPSHGVQVSGIAWRGR